MRVGVYGAIVSSALDTVHDLVRHAVGGLGSCRPGVRSPPASSHVGRPPGASARGPSLPPALAESGSECGSSIGLVGPRAAARALPRH